MVSFLFAFCTSFPIFLLKFFSFMPFLFEGGGFFFREGRGVSPLGSYDVH